MAFGIFHILFTISIIESNPEYKKLPPRRGCYISLADETISKKLKFSIKLWYA